MVGAGGAARPDRGGRIRDEIWGSLLARRGGGTGRAFRPAAKHRVMMNTDRRKRQMQVDEGVRGPRREAPTSAPGTAHHSGGHRAVKMHPRAVQGRAERGATTERAPGGGRGDEFGAVIRAVLSQVNIVRVVFS